MTLSFAPQFSDAWFEGAPATVDVPSLFHVALGGHPYMIEPRLYQRATIPRQRDTVDQSAESGESLLSPTGPWRRHGRRWDHGAGQDFWDGGGDPPSDRARFHSSKGINVFDLERSITLHNDTRNIRAHTAAKQILLTAGGYTYATRDSVIEFTANSNLTGASPSWTANTGGGGPYTSIATDGRYLFACDGADIYRIALGTSGALGAAWSTDNFTWIAYANGFLIGSIGSILYSIDNAAAKTALNGSGHFNANTVFVAAAGTPNGIFVAANNGLRGELYFIQLNATTGALTTPVFAGAMPDGETINSLDYYAAKLVIGTSIGLRLAEIGDKFASIATALEISGGVTCTEPQGQYVWFGWTNYDATSTGLGRANLEVTPVLPLVPAYASDLMATTQGTIQSVITVGTRRYFSVNGVGVFAEYTTKVASGTIRSGQIDIGTPDLKNAVSVEERHEPLDGTVSVSLLTDDGTETSIMTTSIADTLTSGVIQTPALTTEFFEVILTLTRDSGTDTLAPVVKRWTFRGLVAPERVDQFIVPIHMNESVELLNKQPRIMDPLAEFVFLKGLELDGLPVIYQEGISSYLVLVDRVTVPQDEHRKWITSPNDRRMSFMEGIVLVELTGLEPIGA